MEFANGAVGAARRHGDRIEVYGSEGMTYANLHMGDSLPTYSEKGYGYAVEKAPTTKGWSYPAFEELWNYGFPQEMAHFALCVRGKEKPQATGEGRKVQMPFSAKGIQRPIDLWFRGPQYRPSRKNSWKQTRHS